MPSEVPQLLRRAEQIDVTQTRLVRRFAQELARVLREVERALPRLYEQAAGTGDRIRLAQLAQLRLGIRQALTVAGYDALVTVTASSRLADRIARLVLRPSLGVSFVAVEPRIRGLQALLRQDWLGQGDVITRALWQATMRAALAQVPASRLAQQIAPEIARSVRQTRSLVDTAISIYSRQVEAVAYPEAETFVYLGPIDEVTRPFCWQRVGKVYTRKTIDTWDNGTSLASPPMVVCGGWGCRHKLAAISRFSELNALADTGKRAPELAEQKLLT